MDEMLEFGDEKDSYLLFTIYYSLFTIYDLLFTVYYLLFTKKRRDPSHSSSVSISSSPPKGFACFFKACTKELEIP